MGDEETNLTEEEREELAHPVLEDEDPDVEFGDPLEEPSDLPYGGIEDDSGFLEEMVEDGDPVLEQEDGTRVGGGVG